MFIKADRKKMSIIVIWGGIVLVVVAALFFFFWFLFIIGEIKNNLHTNPATEPTTEKSVLPLIGQLPEILGYYGEKTYLLIFQNNMEIRPSGGFIGSYGIVTLENGREKNVFIDDVYNLDKLSEGKLNEPAPAPMLKYNNQPYWYMRDANWYVSWPDSAKNIIGFFDRERQYAGLPAVALDGVVAITPEVIADLLNVVGPVELMGVTFEAKNFTADLERFVEVDYAKYGINQEDRKKVMGEITDVILNRLKNLSPTSYIRAFGAIKKNLDQKHVLAYFFNDKLQKYFSDLDWSGEVSQTDGDYLLIVDSNFAALKTDSVMVKSIKHGVGADANGDLIGRVEITYDHRGDFVSGLISRYRTYVKVYVPDGSWFTGGAIEQGGRMTAINSGDLEYGHEYGKVFAAYFLTVESQDSKKLILTYKFPAKIKKQYENGGYNLTVQKQPGTVGHNLEIDLRFGKKISSYEPGPSSINRGDMAVGWRTDLSVDRRYRVEF